MATSWAALTAARVVGGGEAKGDHTKEVRALGGVFSIVLLEAIGASKLGIHWCDQESRSHKPQVRQMMARPRESWR